MIVTVDKRQLMLNPFMTVLTGNLIDSMARSLKAPAGKKIEFRIKGEDVTLKVDKDNIAINQGSAPKIIGSVFRGLLSCLHGAETGTEFRFLCEKP